MLTNSWLKNWVRHWQRTGRSKRKSPSESVRRRSALLAVALLEDRTVPTLFTGTSSAVFGIPNPSSGIVYSGVGTNELHLGTPASGSFDNMFRIDGVAFSSNNNAPFNVGNLTYRNGAVFNVAPIQNLPVTLGLVFTAPAGAPATNFPFTFRLESTPNSTGNPVLDADILTPVSVTSTTTFTVAGTTYTLKLLGFSQNGGATIVSQFVLPENQTTTASLFATINAFPTADAGGPYSVPEGGSVIVSAAGSSDDGTIVKYEWDFNYTGVFTTDLISTSPTAAFSAAGLDGPSTRTIAVRTTDDQGATGIDTALVTVSNVAPTPNAGADQTVDEGSTVNLSGTFADPGVPDTHTQVWSVVASNGQVIANGSGANFSFIPNDNGIYTVTYAVTDDDNGVGTDTAVVTVLNVAPTADAGTDQTVNEGSTVNLAGTFTDPGTADTHTQVWSVVASNGQVIANGSGANYSFIPNDNGIYTVTYAVTDDDNGVGTDTAVVTVLNVAPTANAGTDQTVNEGSTVNLSGTFTDPGTADTHTQVWSVVASNGQVIANGSGANFSFIPNDNGIYTVTYAVTDDDNGVGTDTAVVTVLNVAPVVDLTGPPAGSAYAVGTPIPFAGTYSDPGTADTHTAVLRFYSVGTGEIFTAPVGVTGGTVSLPTSIASPGVYSVTLFVTDDDLGVGSDSEVGGSSAEVVIYDPAAGFVTGGGWINSPAGAFAANASLSGRATFGLVAKYHNGATVPSGQTEFQFKAGNMNFHITSYDWLIITGARAQYKGHGTINGSGDFSFMVTAIDGQKSGGGGVDKFRIKIWDGSGVIYDNQMGASNDATPTTVLGGGSIVIHSGAPLMAAGGVGAGVIQTPLTSMDLQPIVEEAMRRWAASGLDTDKLAMLHGIAVRVSDLPDSYLGVAFADSNVIEIDANAAGWGWFVDSTPWDDSEFTIPGDQGEQNRMDLLTVLEHEMGHVLGHDHDEDGVMAETLAASTRLTLHGVDVQESWWLAGLPDTNKKRDVFGWWL